MNLPGNPAPTGGAVLAVPALVPGLVPGSVPVSAPAGASNPTPIPTPTTLAQDALRAALGRIRIVLVETSHPGNVGAAARAIKAMGLSHLALVAPRQNGLTVHDEARAMASGADDILAACRVHATLAEALAGCTWAVALTARGREYAPPELDAEGAARHAATLAAHAGAEVALVFGSERAGLSNDHVLACQAICTIDTDPAFSSLNLSQAVQILAFLCRRGALAALSAPAPADAGAAASGPAAGAEAAPLPLRTGAKAAAAPAEPLAGVNEREQMFGHLQEALVAIDFLDPAQPKRLMERLRRMLSHAPLTETEVNILRGICKEMLATAGRAGQIRGPGQSPDRPGDPHGA